MRVQIPLSIIVLCRENVRSRFRYGSRSTVPKRSIVVLLLESATIRRQSRKRKLRARGQFLLSRNFGTCSQTLWVFQDRVRKHLTNVVLLTIHTLGSRVGFQHVSFQRTLLADTHPALVPGHDARPLAPPV